MLPQNWAEYFVQSDVMSVTGISDLILVIVIAIEDSTPLFPVLMKSIVTIYVIGFTSYPCYRTSDMCAVLHMQIILMVGHLIIISLAIPIPMVEIVLQSNTCFHYSSVTFYFYF
jgi:hypothetical protein